MIYIYDIVLNYQKIYYNFFEWKRSDKIINVRKIPLYRVSSNDFNIMKDDYAVISNEFFERIKKDNSGYKNIMCLVSDGSMAMGILFNDNGKIIKRSSMLYDEEDEVCGYAMELDEIVIDYKKIVKNKCKIELRFYKERRNFLVKYLNGIDNDMLYKYLYYECYGVELEDIEIIKKTLLDVANKGYSIIENKLYDSIRVFSSHCH